VHRLLAAKADEQAEQGHRGAEQQRIPDHLSLKSTDTPFCQSERSLR